MFELGKTQEIYYFPSLGFIGSSCNTYLVGVKLIGWLEFEKEFYSL